MESFAEFFVKLAGVLAVGTFGGMGFGFALIWFGGWLSDLVSNDVNEQEADDAGEVPFLRLHHED